jgi:broad specificity phosphatase PhoE
MVMVLAVRHADIDIPPGSDDPELNAAGLVRADALAHVIGSSGVSTILVSRFIRTQQTVEPSARRLGVPPRIAPAATTLARQARSGDLGPVVLVAGHSNTIPTFLTALGAPAEPVIGEREFDSLFVLMTRDGADALLLHLRYGRE